MSHRWRHWRLRWRNGRLWLVRSCIDRGCNAETSRPLW